MGYRCRAYSINVYHTFNVYNVNLQTIVKLNCHVL
jgi:hypothetical protein